MTGAPPDYRLYRELAGWWPLISPATEYAAEAAALAALFGEVTPPAREILDLGSGGGHVAAHLKTGFAMTLVDVSADMLAVSRQLNPECVHIQADMRTVRLGRQFGGVLLHDAVDYITTEADLRLVIETAFVHCRPGGIAVFVPDYTAETFSPGTGGGGSTDEAGRQGSFRERAWDPDPADDWIQVDYEFLLRPAGAPVQVVRETHRLGAFGQHTWLHLLTEAGFQAAARSGSGPLANLFTGRRPQH